jgi:hypothetical protein
VGQVNEVQLLGVIGLPQVFVSTDDWAHQCGKPLNDRASNYVAVAKAATSVRASSALSGPYRCVAVRCPRRPRICGQEQGLARSIATIQQPIATGQNKTYAKIAQSVFGVRTQRPTQATE